MSNDDLRRLLIALRVAFDDANAIARDALRPPRKRELGPVLQKKNYREAARTFYDNHDLLMRLIESAPEGGGGAPH